LRKGGLSKNGLDYGHYFVTTDGTHIVTLPFGYAGGYQPAMAKNGKVIIYHILYPITGRICMDQIMIDIVKNKEVYRGNEVILVGSCDSHTIIFLILPNGVMRVFTSSCLRFPIGSNVDALILTHYF
jgi:alanine racemase